MRMAANQEGLSRAYIFRAVEDSLRRLRTDYIDLYQSHCDDAGTRSRRRCRPTRS